MRARILSVLCVAALATSGLAGSAWGDVVIYDDFPGTTLDTAKWNTSWGSASVGSSLLTISGGGGELLSTAGFSYDTFTFEVGGPFSANNIMGLVSGVNRISLRNDGPAGTYLLNVTSPLDSYTSSGAVTTAPTTGDVLKIVWQAGSVSLYEGNTLLDTVTGLAVPSVAMALNVANYASTGGEGSSQYDTVSVGVPTP